MSTIAPTAPDVERDDAPAQPKRPIYHIWPCRALEDRPPRPGEVALCGRVQQGGRNAGGLSVSQAGRDACVVCVDLARGLGWL